MLFYVQGTGGLEENSRCQWLAGRCFLSTKPVHLWGKLLPHRCSSQDILSTHSTHPATWPAAFPQFYSQFPWFSPPVAHWSVAGTNWQRWQSRSFGRPPQSWKISSLLLPPKELPTKSKRLSWVPTPFLVLAMCCVCNMSGSLLRCLWVRSASVTDVASPHQTPITLYLRSKTCRINTLFPAQSYCSSPVCLWFSITHTELQMWRYHAWTAGLPLVVLHVLSSKYDIREKHWLVVVATRHYSFSTASLCKF